jgi:serine/threonine-protein kinase
VSAGALLHGELIAGPCMSTSEGGSGDDDPQRGLAPVVREALQQLGVFREPRVEPLRAVGHGGVGRVDAVFDHVLRRTAARKSLLEHHHGNPRKLRQFVREARITSQLDHPAIVPVHDLATDDSGQLYFGLKLVEGRTLSQLIDTWREVGVEEAALLDVLDALVKVCDALALAHSRDVVHCDVKPENIMIGDYGETYLMDWGAALVLPEQGAGPGGAWLKRMQNPRPSLPGDSQDDTIGGTPEYMSPEQARGEAERIDPRTDVFGLGATLYEVLTGRSPYADVDEFTALELAERGWFSPLSELIEEEFIPPLLARVIERAMALEKEERYETIEAMRSDLVRYLRGGREFPVVRFAPETVIMTEGDEADCAYIIVRGHCEVVKDLHGERTSVRVLGPGDIFGETALLSPGPRTASVVALEDVSAQVIQRDVLAQELDATRPWLSRLVRTVANRFREADASRDLRRDLSNPLQAARQATMHLFTWGERDEQGTLSMPWSTLCRELTGDDAERARMLRTRLESFPLLHVDTDADRIVLRDADGFAVFLAREC